MPKQVIVGKRGFILYIGPVMTNVQLRGLVQEHIRDTSFGIENRRFFNVKQQIRGDSEEKEVNQVLRFCKHFETDFALETQTLIEYKLMVTERITFFISEDKQKTYECHFTFLSEQSTQKDLTRLIDRLNELKELKSLEVNVEWKHFTDYQVVSQPDYERLLPLQEGCDQLNRIAKCSRCSHQIQKKELVGVCRQCDQTQLFCQKCTLKNRDMYDQYHNNYQRGNIVDHKHALIIVDRFDSLLNKTCLLRYQLVENTLNKIYAEGLEAHAQNHFRERVIHDEAFDETCDDCGVEIEFLLFVCLGCRSLTLCEECYFFQRTHDRLQSETLSAAEHNQMLSESHRTSHSVVGGFAGGGNAGSSAVQRLSTLAKKEHGNKHVFLRCYDYQNPKLRL